MPTLSYFKLKLSFRILPMHFYGNAVDFLWNMPFADSSKFCSINRVFLLHYSIINTFTQVKNLSTFSTNRCQKTNKSLIAITSVWMTINGGVCFMMVMALIRERPLDMMKPVYLGWRVDSRTKWLSLIRIYWRFLRLGGRGFDSSGQVKPKTIKTGPNTSLLGTRAFRFWLKR